MYVVTSYACEIRYSMHVAFENVLFLNSSQFQPKVWCFGLIVSLPMQHSECLSDCGIMGCSNPASDEWWVRENCPLNCVS